MLTSELAHTFALPLGSVCELCSSCCDLLSLILVYNNNNNNKAAASLLPPWTESPSGMHLQHSQSPPNSFMAW